MASTVLGRTTVVQVGNRRFLVKNPYSAEKFGFVYLVRDVESGEKFALKRVLASNKERFDNIVNEVSVLKQLSGHINIVQFFAAEFEKEHSGSGIAEISILTELCTGGQLVEFLRAHQTALPFTILRAFHQTCSAVCHMHQQKPPVMHRDLKVDNLFIGRDGYIKLCDFGSASTKTCKPDMSWTASQMITAADEIAKVTTPSYRAPEMKDLFQYSPIDKKIDIWALGCILFVLCFDEHPFHDGNPLRIMKADYKIPPNDTMFAEFHTLFRLTFKINPVERPNIDEIIVMLNNVLTGPVLAPEATSVLADRDHNRLVHVRYYDDGQHFDRSNFLNLDY